MQLHHQLLLSLQVDKNLRESSDENLMERSQRQFCSTGRQSASLLYHQILQTAEVLLCITTLDFTQKLWTCSLCDWYEVVPEDAFLRVNTLILTPQVELVAFGGIDTPEYSIRPLRKQQNLPQRPTSLHLLPKTPEPTSASSRLKMGKLKSNQQQVQQSLIYVGSV